MTEKIKTAMTEFDNPVELLKSDISPKAMQEKLLSFHEKDIASALTELSRSERAKLYRITDSRELADILEYAEQSEEYIKELSVAKSLEVLSCLEPAAAAEYINTLEKEKRSLLLELLPKEAAEDIMLLLSFDEEEIGSVMTTNYIEINSEISVKEAMHSLVEQAAENDNISTLYVVDGERTFYGAIDLKDLITARETTPLATLVTTSYPYVYAFEAIDDCVERIMKYSEDSIPVLSRDNKLLGVITAQDFVRLVDDEMGEDYAKFAGLSAEEDVNEPLKKSVKKRLPWLFVLLGLGLAVSSVVGVFESVVASLTLVVCFQSLILDMAGNVGTQSLAVTIRVLMDERLGGKDKLRLVFKESRVGIVNGLITGASAFVVTGVYLAFIKDQPIGTAFAIAACIGAALVFSMFFAGTVGAFVPICFKKFKIDPAAASGPLITTVNDLVAVVTYYGLASLLIRFIPSIAQ